ncbi:efflux RND transporter periplasmic adaptor subunit [Pseudoalteromonas luteoviolacea]|uniref:efflux RND transporter periplasmic adaptor subunit n=1 Tax=Pseudoalteromonas luteoviolacea TaxID=43657 RepID=UPI001B3A1F35|nr:efflux RND transporter periplasmic adaptor subunit [Pseudoalteromonas luteoviolacea]MBQ4879608.1 efflux RND transporter periplasmic adaptor subunit [Pseudoalteromonas luteoviolacea]MBQ4909138.1 efflux RND transporter periplasmic adaptor subunit [Pseudoalteromonas luteoviolacea]
MSFKHKALSSVATILVLTFTSACSETNAKPVAPIKVQPTTQAERVSAPTKILYGKVQSERGYDMALFNSGRIEKLAVREGQLVRKDTLIARLYSPNLTTQVIEKEAVLSAAIAAAEEAQSEFERIKNLRDKALTSVAQLEQAEKAAKIAKDTVTQMEAQLKQANNALDEFSIYAPQDGVVASLYAREGQFVSSSKPIIRFEESGKFKVEYWVPERDALTLNMGQPVSIFVPTLNQEINGTINEKAIPSINGPSLFKVSVLIEDKTESLLGLTAQIRIASTNKPVYQVDTNAVRFMPNGEVYMLDKEHNKYNVQLVSTRGSDLLITAEENLDSIQFDTSPEPTLSKNLMAVLEENND